MVKLFKYISRLIKKFIWLLLKPFNDFILMLYDDLEFKAMSLPRVCAFTTTLMVIGAWIGEQFYEKPFLHFNALTGLAVTAWSAYSIKKITIHSEHDQHEVDVPSPPQSPEPPKPPAMISKLKSSSIVGGVVSAVKNKIWRG